MGVTGAGTEPSPVADSSDAPDAAGLRGAGLRGEGIRAGAAPAGGAAVAGLELGGRRARVALAALALTDRPVPADRPAALIWSNAPPPPRPPALPGVIRSLRTALDAVQAGGQRLIVTTPSGYCLAAGASVDLDLAETALAEGSG